MSGRVSEPASKRLEVKRTNRGPHPLAHPPTPLVQPLADTLAHSGIDHAAASRAHHVVVDLDLDAAREVVVHKARVPRAYA